MSKEVRIDTICLDLKNSTMSTGVPIVYLLPPELQRAIALYLPLDSLRGVSTLCKRLFSPFLLYELKFAQLHLAYQMRFKPFMLYQTADLKRTLLLWPFVYRIGAICSFLDSNELNALGNLYWEQAQISHALSLAVSKEMMAMMMESGDKPELVPKTLTWVCLLGHLSTLDWLLAESKWETNPCVNGETVVSCLRIAALDQNVIGIVNRLLSTFRDHFEWEINGSCDLLSFAAKNGHAELLSELLHHPRVNSYIINVSVIHGAIANNGLEIVKLCLQDPRLGTGFNISSCIQYAVELKNAEILDYLLRRQQPGVSPSYDGNMALRTACKRGSLEIVVLLLAHPKLAVLTSDVIVHAIGHAVQAENPKIVELILSDPRCDPTTFHDFYDIFVDACSRGCVDIVRLFLNDSRISFDEFRFRPILAAIRSGNAALVHLLVEDGRLEVGGKENLPLKEAFYGGQKEMVRILINSGRVNPSVIGQ